MRKHINIRAGFDLAGFSTSAQNLEREFKKTARKMTDIGRQMSMAFTAPFAALSGLSMVNFDKQAKAVAQVEAGIKSTGGSAGFTSKQLQDMATELQKMSLFGDEDILKDVTAQLLTFTNIAGSQFAKTQQAALDLATRLDGDLKSASIMLGKALNDPVANLSALSRAGIQFSEEQKKMVKALMDTGKAAEAQDLILTELEKQYGGSAAAAAAVGSGPLQQLKNMLMDTTEAFGKVIFDGISPMIEKGKKLVDFINNLSDEKKKLILQIGAVVAAIGPVLISFGLFAKLGGMVAASLGAILSPIGLVIIAIGALTLAVVNNWDTVKKWAQDISNYFIDIYNNSLIFRAGIEGLALVFKTLWNVGKAVVVALKDIFVMNFKIVGQVLKNLAKMIKGVLTLDFSTIKEGFKGLFADTERVSKAGIDKLNKVTKDAFSNIGNDIGDAFQKTLNGKIENVNFDKVKEKAKDVKLGVTVIQEEEDKGETEDKVIGTKTVQSQLAEIVFAGQKRLKDIRDQFALSQVKDDQMRARMSLEFAQENAMNELDFEIKQLEKKKVLSEDEKAQLKFLQAEKIELLKLHNQEIENLNAEQGINSLEAKEQALQRENDLQKLYNLQGFTDKKTFDEQENAREIKHLEDLLALRKEYGENVLDLEIQLAQKRADIQNKANEETARKAKETTEQVNNLITQTIAQMASKAASHISEMFEQAFSSGGEDTKKFGEGFLNILGGFMVQFGEAMFAIGVAQALVNAGLKSMNPGLAMAGGVALIAAGAALSSLSKSGLQGEVAAPSGGSGGAGSSIGNFDNEPIVLETRIEGDQLILVQSRSSSFRR
jgi:hypothetical protein